MNHNTPEAVPQTATEFLDKAAHTLGERGKQYDPAAKQERSMTAIVAAFNAIYPRNLLTVHMGWQFMSLVKMVRGATKPHADSALDQVAYAALAAEEVASQLEQPEQLHEAYAHNPYAGKPAVEEDVNVMAMFQAERKANVAMHEEVTRLRGEVQELAALAEYRDHRNSELCAELETKSGKCIAQSSRISELQTLVDNLRSSLAQATKEAPCAHNTDEAADLKQKSYVDPFDQYGDTQPLAAKPRIVGDADPTRGGLAYPNGKPL